MTVTSLTEVFRSQMPTDSKANYAVEVEALGENGAPLVITQSEYMRRMKEMSHFQPGMSFYNQMPDSYMVVLNADHVSGQTSARGHQEERRRTVEAHRE